MSRPLVESKKQRSKGSRSLSAETALIGGGATSCAKGERRTRMYMPAVVRGSEHGSPYVSGEDQ